MRPKGLGLGAQKMVDTEAKDVFDKDGKKLVLAKGAFGKIVAGPHKGKFCEVGVSPIYHTEKNFWFQKVIFSYFREILQNYRLDSYHFFFRYNLLMSGLEELASKQVTLMKF